MDIDNLNPEQMRQILKQLQAKSSGTLEDPPADPEGGFDLRVHIRDLKTGKMIKEQPYKLHVDKERGKAFERDGKFYTLNGQEHPTWSRVSPSPSSGPMTQTSGMSQGNRAAMGASTK